MELLVWLGILFCISQSAMFSGLNLAFFSISRLRLEVEASKENRDAIKVLELRKDSNFVLTTILWGNVGINVLLTLLSNSILAGVTAFPLRLRMRSGRSCKGVKTIAYSDCRSSLDSSIMGSHD